MPGKIDTSRRQVFVIGNEAADVDSLVSAYSMAMLLDTKEVQGIALAQIPRQEFRLRGDALALFRRAGSALREDGSPERLVFWDEVDGEELRSLPSRSLVLTDHNKMASKVAEHFEGRVELILDHHANSNAHPNARVELDEGLGSACTLVAEQFWKAGAAVPAEVGVLLAGVIMMDTRNFDPKEAKGNGRDREAFDRLKAAHLPLEAHVWYSELMKARKDVSDLSVRELLLLDMKLARASDGSAIAFSSIFGTLRNTCDKAGGPASLVKEMEALAGDKGYQAVVALFAKDEHGQKGICFVPHHDSTRGQSLCEAISEHCRQMDPAGLPEAFRENPLFASQSILELGFGCSPLDDLRPLLAFTLRGAITRKTLLPFAMTAASL